MPLAKHDRLWTDDALCATHPADPWFTSKGNDSGQRDVGRALCRHCPARRPCLAYALAHCEEYGLWGGLDNEERRTLARIRCPACGRPLGRPAVAAMVLAGRQHARCVACDAWVEVVPPGERPHRNNHITGTGRRT